MAWGTEEDVDRVVRQRLKEERTKHKAEVRKLRERIASLTKKIEELQNGTK